MLQRIEKSAPRPEEDVSESRGGDCLCDADVAEEMPGCGDEGGVVVQLEAGEDVEHYFDGEAVDGEFVELVQVQAGLEALFNLDDACCRAEGEGRVRHFGGWVGRGRYGGGVDKCSWRGARR